MSEVALQNFVKLLTQGVKGKLKPDLRLAIDCNLAMKIDENWIIDFNFDKLSDNIDSWTVE